ncbi:hypothetical protein [Chryseobacterium taeanense]|uniref:hypothetical protein n=1 Tax=Chryseobacterium taeanense TaxID=311334 RepID=UPI0035B3F8D5
MASEKYTVSSVAKLFNVTTESIKKWIYLFSEYLSSGATPPKGNERIFEIEDIRVFAYIYYYWEDDPDIECIKIGLNSDEHYDNELIDSLILQISPFVLEPNNKMDETWKHGVLFSGISEIGDRFYLANSYKQAGDKLVDIALKNEEISDVFCPAIYNYRHATELFLKDAIGYDRKEDKKNGHKLVPLFEKFEIYIKKKYKIKCPEWFKNIIFTFNAFDSEGTTFRYGSQHYIQNEFFIDFQQMKTVMDWLTESFQNFKKNQFLG